MNRQIPYLVVAFLLWAIIPIPVTELTQTYTVFTIVLVRFLPSGAITIALVLGLTAYHNHALARAARAGTPKNGVPVKLGDLLTYLGEKNRGFYGRPQWLYLLLLGAIGIASQIVFYFFGLKLAGVVLTLAATPAAVIIIALYNWGKGREDIDMFKAIYLLLLCLAILVIAIERCAIIDQIDRFGIVSVLFLVAALVLIIIMTDQDAYTVREQRLIKETGNFYATLRLLLKGGLSQLFAAGAIFLIAALFLAFPAGSVPAHEGTQFFAELGSLGSAIFSGSGLFLVVGATVIPYIIWFYASAHWPRDALTFDQWVSILGILEPAGAIIFGVFLLGEPFPPVSLLFLLSSMFLSIFLRYLHEAKHTVNASILVKFRAGCTSRMITRILTSRGVRGFRDLLGPYDAMIDIQIPSVRAYVNFLLWLQDSDATREIKSFQVAKIHK